MTTILKTTLTITLCTMLKLMLSPLAYAQNNNKSTTPKPTIGNVEYGKHDRQKLDFWKASSKTPTPIIIYFHGGGFKKGDKNQIRRSITVQE